VLFQISSKKILLLKSLECPIKISNAIKADLLIAYQIILDERATEFYNGAFR
jgi:hypothetical protein